MRPTQILGISDLQMSSFFVETVIGWKNDFTQTGDVLENMVYEKKKRNARLKWVPWPDEIRSFWVRVLEMEMRKTYVLRFRGVR